MENASDKTIVSLVWQHGKRSLIFSFNAHTRWREESAHSRQCRSYTNSPCIVYERWRARAVQARPIWKHKVRAVLRSCNTNTISQQTADLLRHATLNFPLSRAPPPSGYSDPLSSSKTSLGARFSDVMAHCLL